VLNRDKPAPRHGERPMSLVWRGVRQRRRHTTGEWPSIAPRSAWLAACTVLLATSMNEPVAAMQGEALWHLLRRGGQVVLVRHASTEPGVGDPAGFRVDDCGTQRNLSAAGREEARQLGRAFASRGIPVGRVLSSRWCRCLDTARLAFGRVEPWESLNSFFDDRSRAQAQTQALRQLVAEPPPDGNLILVSHQVNITALTGIVPAPGEMVILTPLGDGEFRVAGRLHPGATAP
jgi:phosphohistidine phosphatase SixA